MFSRKTIFFIILCTCGMLAKGQTVEEWVNQGLALDSQGRWYQAVSAFSKAIEADPARGILYYNRGNSYMNARQYSLALVDFNKAILLDTGIADAWYNRYLANRYTSNFQFALADISEYLKRKPDDLSALEERADLAVEMKEYDQAVADLKKLESLSNGAIVWKMRRAEVLLLAKKYTEAEEIYDLALKADPDAYPLYLSRAYVKYYTGRYEASVADVNLFSLRAPGDPDAMKLKADNYFYLKRFDDALAIFQSLFREDSFNADLMADIGHCLLQQKKYTEADQILTRSILSKTGNPGYAYLGRGIVRLNLGRGDEACADWLKSQMLGEKRAAEYLKINCESKQKSTNPR